MNYYPDFNYGRPAKKPESLDELFDIYRNDWEDCYSSLLETNFVIHVN